MHKIEEPTVHQQLSKRLQVLLFKCAALPRNLQFSLSLPLSTVQSIGVFVCCFLVDQLFFLLYPAARNYKPDMCVPRDQFVPGMGRPDLLSSGN